MLFDDWELDIEEEPQTFRDRTTFDGQDGDDERLHDREIEFLRDHELGLPEDAPRSEQLAGVRVFAKALACRTGGQVRITGGSGFEAEHYGPEQPPAGTSGWEAEQDMPDRPAETRERQAKGENP